MYFVICVQALKCVSSDLVHKHITEELSRQTDMLGKISTLSKTTDEISATQSRYHRKTEP